VGAATYMLDDTARRALCIAAAATAPTCLTLPPKESSKLGSTRVADSWHPSLPIATALLLHHALCMHGVQFAMRGAAARQ
jgi:hypothetical protein